MGSHGQDSFDLWQRVVGDWLEKADQVPFAEHPMGLKCEIVCKGCGNRMVMFTDWRRVAWVLANPGKDPNTVGIEDCGLISDPETGGNTVFWTSAYCKFENEYGQSVGCGNELFACEQPHRIGMLLQLHQRRAKA